MQITGTQGQALAELELRRRRQVAIQQATDEANIKPFTRVGFVNEQGQVEYTLTNEFGGWDLTFEDPQMYLALAMARVLTTTKRFVVLIGGRGSSKSVSIADICLIDAKDADEKTFCVREFQSSIKSSVLSLLKEEIARLEFGAFLSTNKNNILKDNDELFEFAGLARNADSVKSVHGFKRFFVEEAQFLSQDSLEVLTPTARNKPNKGLPRVLGEDAEQEVESNVSITFVANPGSAEDPFSKRFIAPFQSELDSQGFYEDDLHLVVKMNFHDNPWFMDSGLEKERQWALTHMTRELYDHVWLGGYNDSVENSLIVAEWFDACIDAHIKLGFEPLGAKISSYDPSDVGPDSKGYIERHGSVFTDVQEYDRGDANEATHWACGLANQSGADFFTWDCDGLGAALNEQVSKAFTDKPTSIAQFKGSESPDNPDAIYQAALRAPVADQKKNKEVFRNKRAQYYTQLRDRVYRTYRAVVHKEYFDPDLMISFSSDMLLINKLRSELCRMPIKPRSDGLVELYTKQQLRDKFKFASPNLGDAAMMSMRYMSIQKPAVIIPKVVGTMAFGRRHRG